MVEVVFDKKFKNIFSKLKDKSTKEKIISQIEKIKTNPKIGKPMRNIRRGTRELYIKPFRLSYKYSEKENIVKILDIYHKKQQ
ncbi:MAG: type II toxin-antitoxin system RelE/ParE family toxin [archaeon]